MSFQKEKSRKTSSKGRPKKDPDTTLESLPEEEKRRYWREKKSKGKSSTNPEPSQSTTTRHSRSVDSSVGLSVVVAQAQNLGDLHLVPPP